MAHMIDLNGGPSAFSSKLGKMFEPGLQPANSQFNSTIINPGNEPSFTSPYLFNFAGRQDLSVKHSRYIARTYYNAGLGGIPGNSDAGAMQTWQLWNMIGLYPMTGQTTFLIHAPWFAQMSIKLGENKMLEITSEGGDLEGDVYYVQSLEVNNQSWHKSWVTWDEVFENGGVMHFVLGKEVVDWATGDLPPSPAS
jgi:putative alpha-1,2-mannosidase